ncbi:MAG TPA: sirohydrochlorin chelatase [Acidimicrobiales bacterium]|nr:sirohydrochlorin chelatase [Acidimicrobiales bacterium]
MPDAVVLVAHGSRSRAGQDDMAALTASVADSLPAIEVRLGYLELSDPPADTVIDEVLSAGAHDLVVVPLMLHAAGHSKSDVPALVVGGRRRHPGARIAYARPFGADHTLLMLARRRIAEADGLDAPLALLSRGSSDPDANAEAYRTARLVADMVGAPIVAPGFSGVTWPDVPAALAQLQQLGASRVTVFAWFLATGVLIDRMREDFARFADATGIPVVDAGYLGTGREVTELTLARIDEAVRGRVVTNCDACAYRQPFPGLEDRVGLPIGVGHSHLAAEHRTSPPLHAHDHHAHDHHAHDHHAHHQGA